ncbi:MAG: hypothetical protein OXF73_13520, partial [Gammaproteobacteria bacterium]|nr:hypothetical protein [Gammaproteobacteria bacterium]
KPGEPLRGRFDSFCVETDAGLLWAAMRCAIRHAARQSRELGVPGWRQHQHVTGKVVKKAFSQVRTSKLAKRSPGQVRHQLLEGEPVCVIEDQYRFILHHEVMWEGGDAEHAMPTVESAQERPPELCMTLL